MTPAAAPCDTDLWILAATHRPRVRIAEAALQGYIRSWLRVQRLEVRPLASRYADGLDTLWQQLTAAPR